MEHRTQNVTTERAAPSYYSRGKQVIKGAFITAFMLAGGFVASLLSRNFFGGVSAQPTSSSSDGPSDALVPSSTENALASTSLAVSSLSSSSESTVSSSSIFAELEQPGVDVVPEEVTAPKFDTSDLQYPGSLPREQTPVPTAEAKATKQDAVEVKEDDEEIPELDTSDSRYHVSSLGGSSSNASPRTYSFLPQVSLANDADRWRSRFVSNTTGDSTGITLDSSYLDEKNPAIFVGAPNKGTNVGEARVIYGRNTTFPPVVPLATLNEDTLEIDGDANYAQEGQRVIVVDFDSDGKKDGISGSPFGGDGNGAISIIRSLGDRRASPFSVTSIDGDNGLRIIGDNSGFGSALSYGYRGGKPFIVVGSPNGAGRVFLIPGSSGPWLSSMPIATVPNITTIVGAEGEGIGFSVATYRTSTNDADDVYIGAPFVKKVYVIKGNALVPGQIFLNALTPSVGFTLSGDTSGAFGWSIGFLAPISSNGKPAIAIGDPFWEGNTGAISVIYIQDTNYNWASQSPFVTPDGTNWFMITGAHVGDLTGYTTTGIGQFNANSNYTFAFGAPGTNKNAGSLFVMVARNSTWPPYYSLATGVDGDNVVQFTGRANERVGSAVIPVLHSNGYADIAVGARGTSSTPGSFYLIYSNNQIAIINKTFSGVYQSVPIVVDESMLDVSNTFGSNATIIYNALMQNCRFYRNGKPVTTFTNQDVREKSMQFVATDNPSGSVTATDQSIVTEETPLTFQYVGNLRFTITPELTVHQSQIVPIDSVINTSIIGADANDVILYFTTTNGYVAVAGNLNTTVFSARQSDLGSLVFVSNSLYTPSIRITASYNNILNITADAITHFSAFPIKKVLKVTIGPDQTISITAEQIDFDDLYFDPEELKFTFTIRNGVFIVNGSSTATSFTRKQISNQQVSLRQFNTLNGLECNFTVSNQVLTTDQFSLQVAFYLQPYVALNQITAGQQTKPITLVPSMFSVVDPNTDTVIDPNTLRITARNITNCKIVSKYAPDASLTEFDYGQVLAGEIAVVPNGGEESPYAEVSVANSVARSPFIPLNFKWFVAPKVTKCSFNVTQSGLLVLTRENLDVFCPSYTDRSNLRYVFSNMLNCQLVYVNNPSVAIEQCTPDDIDAGNVALVTGSITPSFYVSAAYPPIVQSIPRRAAVNFYRKPVINACIQVNQNQPVTLDTSMLSATSFSVTDPKQITFTTSEEQHCKFAFVSDPDTAIHKFTLQDVIDKKIKIIPDGSATEPSASVTASDGYASSDTTRMVFDFDTLPQVNSDIVVHQGERVPISGMLSATHAYSDQNFLSVNVSAANGWFLILEGQEFVLANSFIQEQLANAYFEQDGTDNTPYGQVTVSDGRVQTQLPLSFTFVPQNTTSNVTKYAIIFSCASGGIGMLFWLFKYFRDQQALNQFPGFSLQQQLCREILATMNLSPCLGAISDNLKYKFKSSVNKLISELQKKGVGTTFAQLTPEQQHQLVQNIVKQTARIILGERGCGYKFGNFFLNFCHAQIKPKQIEDYAYEIAEAVEHVLNEQQVSAVVSSPSEAKRSACVELQPLSGLPPTMVVNSSASSDLVTAHTESVRLISALHREAMNKHSTSLPSVTI